MKHPKKKKADSDVPKDDEKKAQPEAADEVARRKKLLDRLFWIRVGLAAIAGVVATFLFESVEGEERRWASIGFMIAVFIGSTVIGKAMRIGLPPSDRKKIVTTGLGTYVFLYLFMWILSYTLIHHTDVTTLPIKPI